MILEKKLLRAEAGTSKVITFEKPFRGLFPSRGSDVAIADDTGQRFNAKIGRTNWRIEGSGMREWYKRTGAREGDLVRIEKKADGVYRLSLQKGTTTPLPTKQPETSVPTNHDAAMPGGWVTFDPHVVRERPQKSGVYVMFDRNGSPVYVGESEDIAKRWRQHEEKFWFKQPIVEAAAYVPLEDRAERQRLEAALTWVLRRTVLFNRTNRG